jgi:transposase-like protein
MARRHYSEAEKAVALAALDANGGNVRRTARQLGMPKQTLKLWARGRGIHEPVPQARVAQRAALADRLEEVAHQLLDSTLEKIEGAPLQAVFVSLGIAVEKMRLLRDQATSILNHGDLSHDERVARVMAILVQGSGGEGDPRLAEGGPPGTGQIPPVGADPDLDATARPADPGLPQQGG